MFVSIVIPILNEKQYIEKCLDSVLKQEYPQNKYEIMLVDGGSNDGTREIIKKYMDENKNIRLIDNPERIAPCAMNIGIINSVGNLVLIMGAHADYNSDYVSKCVEWSKKTGADNVGGPALAKGEGYWGHAIEYAHYSPFGLGGADFRTGTYEGYTDTVFGGAFRKEVFDRVGLYDERLVRNQDIELNSRIIASGGKCFITPEIRCSYYCRSNLKDLWTQNCNNGMWNIYTTRIARSTLSLRHFVPLIFVSGLVITFLLLIMGFIVSKNWSIYFTLSFLLCIGSYILTASFFSFQIAMRKGIKYFPALLAVFAILHISYGWGSIKGIFTVREWANNRLKKGD